ncbi:MULTISPECIES: hypothetical protein [Kitasatospora]|uniref:hypothetical protein n=1 Tax=Kitasatospora TaxID=2063 RepID=UPI000C27FE13|nr:hypothetical protein [Kitasatospora sp. CB02891]PJN21138.1 hypothetical protein CG736_34925 [Kitasatospora sp. CB02891]
MTTWTDRTAALLAAPGTDDAFVGAWTLFDRTAAWAVGPAADQGDTLAALGAYNLAVEARELLPEPTAVAVAVAGAPALGDGPALADLLDQAQQRLSTIADNGPAAGACEPAQASLLAARMARAVRTASR